MARKNTGEFDHPLGNEFPSAPPKNKASGKPFDYWSAGDVPFGGFTGNDAGAEEIAGLRVPTLGAG